MATISNATDLISTVTEYLARDQDTTLIARIPTFIQLTEAKLNRELFVRQMEQRSTTIIDPDSTDPEFITLPDDFQSMRRARLSSVTGKPNLEFMTSIQMDDFRCASGDVAGRPRYFSITGTEMELAPTPNEAYTIEMVYRMVVPPLASNPTNWLLDLAPDLYLYGTLLESAPYIQQDERINTWGLGFKTALDALNDLGMRSTFDAGPSTIWLPGPTP